MKQGSTLFLKAVLVFMTLVSLGISGYILYDTFSRPAEVRNIPFLMVLWATIPFIYALYQAFTLLNFIDRNIAFSNSSIEALKHIKYSAIAMSAIFYAELPVIFQIAQEEDAPGLILMWGAFASAPIVVAVFAAVLQKLLKNGMDLKSENDLTV